MLDSIREIFDILDFDLKSVGFELIEYKGLEELTDAIRNGKCPVVDVLKQYLYLKFDLFFSDEGGSHAMVATGIKNKDGVKYIQLKNSFADNSNEQGRVRYDLS